MKNTLTVVAALWLGLMLGAAEPPPPSRNELAALDQFLALDDAQLVKLQQAIARVRAMTPEERARLRGQIAEFRNLPPARREELRRGWGQEPADVREGWREMMQTLDEADREEVRRRLESAAPEDRVKIRRELVEKFRRTQAGKH